MAYKKVSIPKNGDGAGCPIPKNPNITFIDVEDIQTEPTRTLGTVTLTGDYVLKGETAAFTVYGTPSTIDESFEVVGEVDAKGFKQKISFEHPGDSDTISNFIEACINHHFVILVKECDGTAEGKTKAYGSVCNPMVMSVEPTNNKEAVKSKFSFTQELPGKFLPGIYSGKAPAPAGAAAASIMETA